MGDAAHESRLPDVLVHPGLLFVVSLAAAWLLEEIAPLPLGGGTDSSAAIAATAALFIFGAAMIAWSQAVFRRRATSPEPGSDPVALVTDGPFRYSRNPMYGGLLAFSLAFAVIVSSIWFLAATAALAATLDRIVIPREERVMSAAFGEAYEAYRSRVRRWV